MENKLTLKDFPGGSDGKVSVYNVEDLGSIPRLMRETWIRSLGWEDSLEKEMATTPVLLPRKSHGQRSLVSMGSQRVGQDCATSLSLSLVMISQLPKVIHIY